MRVTFSSDGIPGPWWRDNATQPDFDRDLRMCRNRSNAARRDPGEGTDAHDAAYRAFLDCMDALAWTRGFPPPRLPANQPAS